MALTKIDDRGLKTPIDLLDNEKIRFGTGNDLEIYHSGTSSYIQDNGTGDLIIRASDQLKIQDTDNGESMAIFNKDGAVELYYDNTKRLYTRSTGAGIAGTLYLTGDILATADNQKLLIGAGNDLQIYHDGTNSRIHNSTGDLVHRTEDQFGWYNAAGSETVATFTVNGSCDLYYDNVKKFETTSGGVQVNGDFKILNGGDDVFFDASENWMRWDDNVKIQCGNSGDLNIYHDGSNSFIENTTGNIYIQNDSSSTSEEILIRPKAGEQSARFIANGAVELYWNNVKTLETNSEGITVQGNEGSAGAIYLYADEGDDNADKWLLQAKSDSSAFAIQNNKSGAWDNSLKCYGDGAVDLYYDNELRLSTTTTGTYFNEKQLVTGGTCKFRTYGGPISVSNNSYHDCQLSSNFGNDSAIRIEYSYNWNDGDGGAWGSAVVWNEHDSANTRSRFLGEEISGPGSSVEFVTSGSNVYFRFNSSGMNGTFIIAAYATQCDLY